MILVNEEKWRDAERRIRKACRDGYAILSIENDGIVMLKTGEVGNYSGDAHLIFSDSSAVNFAFKWWNND